MSDRPTPIVDSCEFTVPFAGKVIVSKTARRLERERDDYKEAFEIASRSADDQMFQKRDAERERDEARDLVCAWENRWKAEVEFAAKVSAKRDELLDILRKLLEIIPEPECYDFGHTKEERHAFLEECPVMARYDAIIAQAKEAAK